MALWVMGMWLFAMATPMVKSQVDECDVTKGCFRSPNGCTGPADCDLYASWVMNADGSHSFQISGVADSWVALGFSKSGGMMDSDVYACTENQEVVRSRNAMGRTNNPQILKGVSDVEVTLNANIECSFTRQASLNDNDRTYYDLSGSNMYTIIMARGSSLSAEGNLMAHNFDPSGRVFTPSPVNFNEFAAPAMGTGPTLPAMTENMMTTQLVIRPQDPLTLEGCNITKGCFRYPPDCYSINTCSYFLSWTVEQRSNRFEMAGDVGTYIAVGFSKSGGMRDSDVYACTKNMEIVRSRNTMGNVNDPSPTLTGVSDIAISAVDGKIQCSFTRMASIRNDMTFFDLRDMNNYHIIMAKSGAGLASDGNIERHYGGRVIGPRTSFRSVMPPPAANGSGECGTTIGCFQDPPGCVGSACEFSVTWSRKPDRNHIFTLSGNANTYVALGFSKSGRMADSDVYACTSNGEVVRSRNTGGNNNDGSPALKGVSAETVTMVNGRIECTFTREATLNGDPKYYDLSGNRMYTIIMAKSSGSLAPDGNIMIHERRVFAGGRVSFNEFTSVGGAVDNTRLMHKAHGCLMIIAWIGFASIGITIARYFKSMSPGKMICDKKPIWFAVHRFCMISAFLLTIAGFVIIFISVGGFVPQSGGRGPDTRFIHAICGTVVTFLAILNPIMAAFRPHPGTSRRPIFNWAHWGVGITAHLGGKATVFLALASVGSAMPLIQGLPYWLFWVMVAFTIYHFVNWMIFGFRLMRRKETVRRSDTMRMAPSEGGYSLQGRTVKNMNDKTSNIMFDIYVISVVIVVAILVVTIATL